MDGRFDRTVALIGKEAFGKLTRARVIIFGVGGVGGYAAEALARSGVGSIDLVDPDVVNLSNINRQIIALSSSVGGYKADAMAKRIAEINPECRVRTHKIFFLPESSAEIDFSEYDYSIDAIDTVAGKIAIIENSLRAGVPVISAMGTGNKLDPLRVEVADLYSTSVCPLARVMRRELRRRGVDKLKVVYSREEPSACGCADESDRSVPASLVTVPAVAGLVLASEVMKDLMAKVR